MINFIHRHHFGYCCPCPRVYSRHTSYLLNVHHILISLLILVRNAKIQLVYGFHCIKSVHIWSYSGPYFPTFGLNTERYFISLRIQSECGKIRTRITPNTDTFYAVFVPSIIANFINFTQKIRFNFPSLYYFILRDNIFFSFITVALTKPKISFLKVTPFKLLEGKLPNNLKTLPLLISRHKTGDTQELLVQAHSRLQNNCNH